MGLKVTLHAGPEEVQNRKGEPTSCKDNSNGHSSHLRRWAKVYDSAILGRMRWWNGVCLRRPYPKKLVSSSMRDNRPTGGNDLGALTRETVRSSIPNMALLPPFDRK